MDKAKVRSWIFNFCVTAVVFIYALYVIGVFKGYLPVVCDFLNNILSSMNLSSRVSVHAVDSIFGFIMCFSLGIVYPRISFAVNGVNTSKKWKLIGLCSCGFLYAITLENSTTFFYHVIGFIINFIWYILGVLVRWLFNNHFKKKEKNSDSKKT